MIAVIAASRDLNVLPRKPHSPTNNYNHFNLVMIYIYKIPIIDKKRKYSRLLFIMIIIK
ncbi:hypothetical protein GCM10007203_09310 [Staphylococcus nepalensis]|nr:hypothetical protein GCM10007203_09310 [Staphylococcus nepalensis]